MSIYLSQDLIEEIFERLPPKTLVRFRSLSKSWYSRISSPDFIHRHKSRSLRKDLIIHTYYHKGSAEYICTLHSEGQLSLCPEYPYKDIMAVKFPGRYPESLGSCNGILCLLDYKNEDCRVCLWNFSIRRKLTLPDHPCLRRGEISPPSVLLGFGFDPIMNDYKIVSIPYCDEWVDVRKSYLYSLKTNSWSVIASPTTPVSQAKTHQACFLNGQLHWVVRYHSKRELFIMTFHLSIHVFGTIALPQPMSQLTITDVILRVIDGSLAVMSNYNVWVRREYDNVASWSIVYNHRTMDLSSIIKFRDTSYQIKIETYVESLELLDKGTFCGETISWKKKAT